MEEVHLKIKVTFGWDVAYIHETHAERRNRSPGGIFLVFFRHEEPDELSVAHPAFPLHSVTPGNKSDSVVHIQYCHHGEAISSSVFVHVRVSTYRVTAPENNLSMILFEDAVRGEKEEK